METCLRGVFRFSSPCMLTGFYEEPACNGLSSYDRIYAPSTVVDDVMAGSAYIYVVGHGIREDGRGRSFLHDYKRPI